ncbi:hypothetical protein CHS0354_004809 [Potamilus streckersoni]|uniref:Uncharacterized protein n=1 Tax=Potamilus streckersoni TaxID=2493646 RepID=A0AAE0S8W6_9BIVA|nr:hypothetical protein CHS0354_004809 [Potamilus streckersoni]
MEYGYLGLSGQRVLRRAVPGCIHGQERASTLTESPMVGPVTEAHQKQRNAIVTFVQLNLI